MQTCFRHDYAIYLILTREWQKKLKLSCNLKFCSIQLLIHIQTFYKINWGESSTAKLAQQLEVCLQHVYRFCFQRWSFTCSLHDSIIGLLASRHQTFLRQKHFTTEILRCNLQFNLRFASLVEAKNQKTSIFNVNTRLNLDYVTNKFVVDGLER